MVVLIMPPEAGVVVDSFVLGGAEVAERRVQSAGVVPALDVVADAAAKSCPRWPGASVDELSFDGGETTATALSQRSPLRPTQAYDAVVPCQVGEISTGVLLGFKGLKQHFPGRCP